MAIYLVMFEESAVYGGQIPVLVTANKSDADKLMGTSNDEAWFSHIQVWEDGKLVRRYSSHEEA